MLAQGAGFVYPCLFGFMVLCLVAMFIAKAWAWIRERIGIDRSLLENDDLIESFLRRR